MRWIQHWKIGTECLGSSNGSTSIAYQLGTIMPDWFEKQSPHTINKSLDIVLDRISILCRLPKSDIRRQFMLGTVVHFLTDFCCYSHTEQNYKKWIYHRIFEVKAQKLYCSQKTYKYILNMDDFYNEFIQQCPKSDFGVYYYDTYKNIANFIDYYKDTIQYRYITPHIKWYYDETIMNKDTYCAYNLIYGVLALLDEFQ